MTVAVAVNEGREVGAGQTTWMLALAAARLGRDVIVFGVENWGIEDGVMSVRGVGVAPDLPGDRGQALAQALEAGTIERKLGESDALLLRTNPARDGRRRGHHDALMTAARVARDRGLRVVNDPDAIAVFGTKLGLTALEASWRPVTRIVSGATAVRDFVAQHGPSVVKPVSGTRGRGVFFVDLPDDPNLGALVELLSGDGPVVVQGRIAGAEGGDVRVVVVDGEVLEVAGETAAIARRPATGQLRSNIHAGGAPEEVALSSTQRHVAGEVATFLAERGVRVAGLDLIGPQVLEVNVYSPGGLRDAERFYGVDFSRALVERLIG